MPWASVGRGRRLPSIDSVETSIDQNGKVPCVEWVKSQGLKAWAMVHQVGRAQSVSSAMTIMTQRIHIPRTRTWTWPLFW